MNNCNGQLFHSDASRLLKSLDEATADVVFLDPPFNLGKTYANGATGLDNKSEEEYRRWMWTILSESSRILKDGAALYLYHLPMWAMRLGRELEEKCKLRFQHWIAISMKNGFVRNERLYPAHYALLLFTKNRPRVFNRPKLKPAICRHCKKLIKDYGGYRPIIERKGINLSDVWEDLSPVRHANRKHRVANELPSALFERVIEISGIRGGLYVDPFAGSGSGVVSALNAGMNFVACDLVKTNCQIISQRLSTFQGHE